MKRFLALILTVLLCVSLFPGAYAATFSDIAEDHRHAEAVAYLTQKGVINGYEDGSFKPENTITRAEFLKMVLEFLGFGNIYGEAIVKTGFDDVDANGGVQQHWAAGYIKLAVDKGVVNGYGDGTFLPDASVKYEEAIKMVVCCLGREDHAKNKAQSIGRDVWPDGYLSVGNDLMISKNTDYLLGAEATRSNIAQMLHNVKDVQIYVAPTISIGSGYSGGGSSGGGGSKNDDVSDSTVRVEGLEVYGQVVAAAKKTVDTYKTIFIDDNIMIDGEPVKSIGKNFIVLKLDNPDNDGNNYGLFHTGGTDYSGFMGYRVKLGYSFNPDGGTDGRNEISTVTKKDTEVAEINSGDFQREKTKAKYTTESDVHLYYTDGDENYEQSLYTANLDSLTVIYNNKVVDTAKQSLTLDDFMPESGKIKIVDGYDDNEIDVVWIDSYETYVVGTRSFGNTPKKITDKFRKITTEDGKTVADELILDDENSAVNLEIYEKGEEAEVKDIANNDVLKVAQSKCGTNVEITIEDTTRVTSKLASPRTVSGVKTAFVMENKNTYDLSDYYVKNVDETLDYEVGDSMELYLNSAGEVVWATVKGVTYTTGYLVSAKYNESTEELVLNILTPSGTITKFTMEKSKSAKYITKAHACLDGAVEPDSVANDYGYVYKNLSGKLIEQSLLENAAIINEGKPSEVVVNAETAQPVKYVVSSGNTLSYLVTLEQDTNNSFTGESLMFDEENYFSNETTLFAAGNTATLICVPNDRQSDVSYYKNAKISSLTKYMEYNIEPFFTVNSEGKRERTLFVLYNESVDARPNYRSDNIIVSSITEKYNSSTEETEYSLKGYVASNTTTKEYSADSNEAFDEAYVLDGSFERMYTLDENENKVYTRRKVEVGDVIRVGYRPDGKTIADVEIILDASPEYKAEAMKATAVSDEAEAMDVESPKSSSIYYYARVGEITGLDESDVPTYCEIKISDAITKSRVSKTSGYSATKILIYDYTESDIPGTEDKDERLQVATMADIEVGDVLYVWQTKSKAFKQIYAIRYKQNQD